LRGDFRAWWEAYLRTVLERDLPQYGVRADPLFCGACSRCWRIFTVGC